MLSADGGTLLLHTPWFFQFFALNLQSAGQRVSCEETGHYLKYAAISGRGDRIFFAGAKLLEEEQSAEARWGSWVFQHGIWKPDWAGAAESYGNSHLRGVTISQDGKTLLLELYQERYEARIYNSDGTMRMRKEGVERPSMSPDAFLMLWENKADGLVLGDMKGKLKLWNRLGVEKIRHKTVDNSGKTFAIEGRRLLRLEQNGDLLKEAWFNADPFRMVSSTDGSMLAVVRQSKGGFVGLPSA